MRLFVYDMLVNVNVIYYVHVCEQALWARSVGNSAVENLCIIITIVKCTGLFLFFCFFMELVSGVVWGGFDLSHFLF